MSHNSIHKVSIFILVHSIYVLHHQKSYGSQEILVSLNIRKKSFSFLIWIRKTLQMGRGYRSKSFLPKRRLHFPNVIGMTISLWIRTSRWHNVILRLFRVFLIGIFDWRSESNFNQVAFGLNDGRINVKFIPFNKDNLSLL